MKETLLNMALAVGILGASALITHLFARVMYITYPNCRTLNARRRIRCRNCGKALPTRAPSSL